MHYSIMQCVFSPKNLLCSAYWSLFTIQTPSNHWLFFCSFHSFAFSRMSYNLNHKYVAFSDWLLSLCDMHLTFKFLPCLFFPWQLIFFFFFGTKWYYPIVWMHHSLFGHLLKDMFIASKFWQLWIMLLCTSCAGFYATYFSTLLVKYQRALLLNHIRVWLDL